MGKCHFIASRFGLLAVVLLACGCATQSAPPPEKIITTPRAEPRYADLKAAYLNANPDARIGRVDAVLAAQSRLAVSDVSVGDFQVGDPLIIVNRDFDIVADATVTDVRNDTLFASYTRPTTGGGGAPAVGDMAIRAEQPERALPR
jgi:hypothetical protein